MTLPAALRKLALEHDGVLVADDFRSRGINRAAVHRLVRTGDLIPVGRGVHRVSAHPLTMRTRVRMTAHRAGGQAVVCGHAAAWWWDATDKCPSQIAITVPPRYQASVPGAIIRHRQLPADDVVINCGLRVTSLALSVLEAGMKVVDSALLREKVTEEQLRAAVDRRRGSRDVEHLRKILLGIGSGARSAAEREAVRIFTSAGITGWIANYPSRGYIIDFAFPAAKVAVEIDGIAYHANDAHRFQHDRHRNNALSGDWNVLHFTWKDLIERPDYVIETVSKALAATAA